MQQYIDDFISYIKLERKLSINTISSYQFDLIEFNHFFKNKKIDNIKEQDILNYLEFLKEGKKGKVCHSKQYEPFHTDENTAYQGYDRL